jgi:hypothetical protein
MPIEIILAESDDEINACYPVMAELRPHVSESGFLSRVRRQMEIAGYQIASANEGEVKAVGGFRISECLAWGKFMYVDDLVSKADDRSKGYGGVLFDWLVEYARKNDCDQFHLDSGVHRFRAHRFYLMRHMEIQAHHFGLKLK